jgi:AcrR family transcriptional regulator
MGRRLLREKKKPSILIRDSALRQQRREQVAGAALTLFIRDGFHATGVRDIARDAGVSPGSVLTYFQDKEAILFYLFNREQHKVEEQLGAVLARIRREATPESDPREIIGQVVDTYARVVDEVGPFTLLAYQETKSLRKEWRDELFAREQRILALVVEAIEYGVRQGVFARDHVLTRAHSITVLIHTWAVRRWALRETPTVAEYADLLKPMILGLLSQSAAAKGKGARTRPKEVRQAA